MIEAPVASLGSRLVDAIGAAEDHTDAGQHSLCVLDATGDTKTIWNPQNDAEVAAAKATFDALRKKGYIAYAVQPDGEKGSVIHEFDASAEKIILAPPMVGG